MKSIRLNRRRFLQAAGLATAPFILPARVWSADAKPSNRVTLGFIGMGKQNSGLLGRFRSKSEVQVAAVCDVDTNRREHAKKSVEEFYGRQAAKGSWKGCAAYNDFRELLARKDIDAVVIATPDHWHAPISIAAANAGKDIYCEKPLCQSIHEARAMVNAVRRNRRVFQTGSMQRSSSEFRVACEIVRNGLLGKIDRITVAVGGPGKWCDLPEEKAEPGLDWNLWLGPAPERPYNSVLSPRGVHNHFPAWRNYREYGGGMITDWGAHHFDIAQWGLGMDESGPVEVTPAKDAKATHGVRFKYAGGTEVEHVNTTNGVRFFGAKGELFVSRGKFELTLDGKEITTNRKDVEKVEKELLAGAKVRLHNTNGDHYGDFLNCMRTRKRPLCDVEVGARTVSVCHLVNLAYYNHTRLKWDPRQEQFVGGAGKAEWLDVPHRGEWKV